MDSFIKDHKLRIYKAIRASLNRFRCQGEKLHFFIFLELPSLNRLFLYTEVCFTAERDCNSLLYEMCPNVHCNLLCSLPVITSRVYCYPVMPCKFALPFPEKMVMLSSQPSCLTTQNDVFFSGVGSQNMMYTFSKVGKTCTLKVPR